MGKLEHITLKPNVAKYNTILKKNVRAAKTHIMISMIYPIRVGRKGHSLRSSQMIVKLLVRK